MLDGYSGNRDIAPVLNIGFRLAATTYVFATNFYRGGEPVVSYGLYTGPPDVCLHKASSSGLVAGTVPSDIAPV